MLFLDREGSWKCVAATDVITLSGMLAHYTHCKPFEVALQPSTKVFPNLLAFLSLAKLIVLGFCLTECSAQPSSSSFSFLPFFPASRKVGKSQPWTHQEKVWPPVWSPLFPNLASSSQNYSLI